MGKKRNGLKIIIILLVLIIILLVGFIIFFIEEFIDEKEEFRNLYNSNERGYTEMEDNITNNSYNGNNTNNVPNNSDINEKYITKEKALEIALTNAQINQNDIYDIEVELDYKYSQTVYEVNFNYQKYEYEYYINAENGKILKSFREID